MNNYIKEIKAILIFLLIIAAFGGLIYFLSFPGVKTYFFITFTSYVILCIICGILKSIFKNKILNKIADIILIPAGIIYVLGYFILPLGTLLMHIMLYFTISFATIFLALELIHKFYWFSIITKPTLLYIQITSSVFIAVLFNYQLRKLIYKISPARINSSRKLKPYKLDKLTDYLISEKNIKFLIYSLYVLALIIINYFKFQGASYYDNSKLDNAVLQSFITFIAFDRVIALLKELDFKPSDLLLKIWDSISNKIEDLKKNNS